MDSTSSSWNNHQRNQEEHNKQRKRVSLHRNNYQKNANQVTSSLRSPHRFAMRCSGADPSLLKPLHLTLSTSAITGHYYHRPLVVTVHVSAASARTTSCNRSWVPSAFVLRALQSTMEVSLSLSESEWSGGRSLFIFPLLWSLLHHPAPEKTEWSTASPVYTVRTPAVAAP